jgi:hypothetical protein
MAAFSGTNTFFFLIRRDELERLNFRFILFRSWIKQEAVWLGMRNGSGLGAQYKQTMVLYLKSIESL